MKISAVMIVKDEEEILERCLKSLEGFDEIVILDTGSTDHTGEIARKYTDKYFDNVYKWRDDFAEARNIAQALATTEWRFIIDSDEFLEDGALAKLRDFIETTPYRVIDIPCLDEINKAKHYQPRLYRNALDLVWKRRIHNYLSQVGEVRFDDVHVYYGYSKAHRLDPDRALRILLKVLEEEPNVVRECYYLAREYEYRAKWDDAIKWYKTYLQRGTWGPEVAEAYFRLSHCYWSTGKWSDAREACLDAIGVNADFKAALEWMAYTSGPNNKERWLLFSESAEDNNTLFGSNDVEMGTNYWDVYSEDNTKYHEIWKVIGNWVGEESNILDCGCGTGEIRKFIKGNYFGFDFSSKTIKKAEKIEGSELWVGNIYDSQNYEGDYDICMALRLLEYVKDRDFIKLIRGDNEFIFTVPSEPHTGQLRFYTEKSLQRRLGDLLIIDEIIRFNWTSLGWRLAPNTNDYILLVKSRRK